MYIIDWERISWSVRPLSGSPFVTVLFSRYLGVHHQL
uniref:Uncharacterized protein n=1 Tax=Anguilla anguilla TaxID=7936 RepID=A0A0E9QC06_ANGAN